MKWGLVIAHRAKRHYRRLLIEEREQIDAALAEICDKPLSGDTKFLRVSRGALRHGAGDWRIIFDLDREKRIVLVINDITRRGSHTY